MAQTRGESEMAACDQRGIFVAVAARMVVTVVGSVFAGGFVDDGRVASVRCVRCVRGRRRRWRGW